MRHTKKRMAEIMIFAYTTRDKNLLTIAARKEEISLAEFIRRSIRERIALMLDIEETDSLPVTRPLRAKNKMRRHAVSEWQDQHL